MTAQTDSSRGTLPRDFVWRRIHSLMGLFIVIFLIEHLITNSQAALWIGDEGRGFVTLANLLHNLPYRQAIELFLLGVPFLIHAVWGIKILLTAKPNSSKSDGSKPSLPEYGRNRAYTWQRITSWILLFTLIVHVVKFRFIEYPEAIKTNGMTLYQLKVTQDPGLASVAKRLNVELHEAATFHKGKSLKSNEVVISTPDFGTATLMGVRDTFKSYTWCAFYTIFVLAATFHAFNGLWTFLITWGLVFRYAAQQSMVKVAYTLMAILTFLGLAAIWGTYWVNLKI